MALLKIIKLSEGVWKHWSDLDGFFGLTRLYAKIENNKFLIVEAYGAKRRTYAISEIEVYNIGGGAETFANFDDLQIRLKALNYIGYDASFAGSLIDNTASHNKGDYNATTNTPSLTNGTGQIGDYYTVSVAGSRDFGAGSISFGVGDIIEYTGAIYRKLANNNQTSSSSVTLTKKTITSANLTTQDVVGFLTYVNGVTSFAIASNEIVEYLVSDTGQIFKLLVNNRSVGSGQTALTSADILLSFEDLTISTKSWASWQVGGLGTTAPVVQNGQVLGVTGTAGVVAFDMDTPIKSIPFIKATGSSGAGQSCGWKEINSNNVSLITGFDYYFTYMPEDTTANSRGFVGLYGTTAAIPNVEPSNFTVPNVGLAHDTTDTNLQIMHNDNAGTSTKVPLGANFPANDNTKAYMLHLRSEPVSSSANAVIYWTVTELISKNSTSGVITTDLPRNSTTGVSSLTHAIWRNTGANATVPIVRMSKIFFRRLRA